MKGAPSSSSRRYGHELSGFDLPDKADALRARLGPLLGADFTARVRLMEDERRIPFEDQRFDVVYSNQVFEHIRFLDQMLAECTRVLKPDGALVTLFPLATYPLEGHVLVPFAHWLPPGRWRRRYLRATLSLGIGRRMPGLSVKEAAREWDERLRLYTFYRFMNEIEALLTYYFEEWTIDTGAYVRAKADLLQGRASAARRALGRQLARAQGPIVDALVTYGFNAVFVARRPRALGSRRAAMEWRPQAPPG